MSRDLNFALFMWKQQRDILLSDISFSLQYSNFYNNNLFYSHSDLNYLFLCPILNKATPSFYYISSSQFGFITNQFGLLNHYQKLRVGLSPVGHYFPVAALFSNLLRCFGCYDTTQSYFGLPPPIPEQYLTPRAQWDMTRLVPIVPDYFDNVRKLGVSFCVCRVRQRKSRVRVKSDQRVQEQIEINNMCIESKRTNVMGYE